MSLEEQLDLSKMPVHIAIIMDGNGRWAKKRFLPRIIGHTNGAKTVRSIVTTARRLNIKVLTLYAFSTENWTRPADEISGLMDLLRAYLKSELSTMLKNNIAFKAIGDITKLPQDLQKTIHEIEIETKNNAVMTLNIALNYGSRQELTNAFKLLSQKGITEPTEQDISDCLYTAGQPDPDLMIRTSGELRISNFLLWQLAYSEIYITDILWPDFSEEEFIKAILAYQKRERRFGGI